MEADLPKIRTISTVSKKAATGLWAFRKSWVQLLKPNLEADYAIRVERQREQVELDDLREQWSQDSDGNWYPASDKAAQTEQALFSFEDRYTPRSPIWEGTAEEFR